MPSTARSDGTERPPAKAGPNRYCDPDERFTIVTGAGLDLEEFLRMDAYAAARAFVSGQVDVQGDIVAAVRFFNKGQHSAIQSLWHSVAARLGHAGLSLNERAQALRDIQFHYDRSNEFYAQFLDSRMQYSAGHYQNRRLSLEEAQLQKLDRVCRAMELQPGERLLDVGCGWGGLVVHAAERFGVIATGCTLSRAQFEFASALVRRKGLEGRVSIHLKDYRELEGRFRKIASIGMFEHVGRRHLPEYFGQVIALLDGDGLFLNRGIVRPESVGDGPDTFYLQRNIFPGGELEHLADVVRDAGKSGFEVQTMEDFRPDYGLTCKAWVARLRQNVDACCSIVDASTYRTWLLYLAESSACFENGTTDAVQILFRKSPGAQ